MSQSTQSIVSTIREGIRNFQTNHKQPDMRRPESLGFESDLLEADRRFKHQLDRFAEIKTSWAAADSELADVISHLGECPPTPDTLRGRLGRALIQFLNRVLWWKTVENRRLAESLRRVSQVQAAQLEALGDALAEQSRMSGVVQGPLGPVVALRSQVAALQDDLDRRVWAIEEVLLDLKSWRTELPARVEEIAASTKHMPGRISEMAESLQQTQVELQVMRLHLEENRAAAQNLGNELAGRIDGVKQEYAQSAAQLSVAHSLQADLVARSDQALLRLGILEEVAARMTGEIQSSSEEFKNNLASEFQRWDQSISSIGARLGGLEESARQLDEIRRTLASEFQRRDESISSFGRRLGDLGLQNQRIRADVSLQDRRLSIFLTEARRRLPEPFDKKQVQTLLSKEKELFDSLYLSFENIYRGTRGEIKERQSVYLPPLRDAGVGTPSMPVLDLGCGRGEWLELLASQGWTAFGVDSNEAMLEECRQQGLKVEYGDALEYLQNVPEATLGAITSFHMVEHIPFDRVTALVDAALRALRPGGVLILETPNPDNLMVGASSFWLDPTHIRPIPSGTLRFVVDARGFCNVEIWNLHPMPESAHLPEDPGGIAARLNNLLCGPRDYGIIGRRP